MYSNTNYRKIKIENIKIIKEQIYENIKIYNYDKNIQINQTKKKYKSNKSNFMNKVHNGGFSPEFSVSMLKEIIAMVWDYV